MNAPSTTTAPPLPLGDAAATHGATSTGGGLRRTLFLTAALARPRHDGGGAVALPVVAFTLTTALLLTVVGGTRMFFTDSRAVEAGVLYPVLSMLALLLLAVPIATLGAAAARLSSRRRNDRLSTLRLLGATGSEVSAMAVIEAAVVATVGVILGAALYAAALPLVGLLSFFGAPIGAVAVWTGWPLLLAAMVAVVVIATLSAAASLQRVRLTPLGVRRRTEAPPRRMRVLIVGTLALVAVIAAASQAGSLSSLLGPAVGLGILLALFAGALALLNLIGTPLVAARGRAMARRAQTASRLIAGRELAAHAATAWRRVSSIAMISFLAVVGGCGVALVGVADAGPDAVLFADIRTGVLVTLAAGFVLLACSVGVTHAASVLDDRELIVGLDRIGMSPSEFGRARRITVMLPLRWAAAGGALVGAVLAFPVVGMSIVVAPMTLVVIAVTFVAGFGLVALALLASRPLVAALRRG